MAMETLFSQLWFGKIFMKIRSAVPENGCLIFYGGQKKKQKKQEKNKKKHLQNIYASASSAVA